MNRRALLKALPAAVVAGAAPAAALCIVDPAESRIIQLYRRFYEISAQLNEYYDAGCPEILPGEDEDQHLERMFYKERDRVEDELMATPCQTPGDFAAKMIVGTCKGEIFPDWEEGELWKEARALVA